MIADFEHGTDTDMQEQSTTAGGQTIYTLSTTTMQTTDATRCKRKRNEMTSDSSGSFIIPDDTKLPKLACNTEKDTGGRLNYRTAG
jgi:hypothetical protein